MAPLARPLARSAAWRAALAGAAVLLVSAVPTAGGDWPAWRGPDRTGVSTETGWRADWSEGPPPVLWKAQVGKGFSTVSVVDGRVYTMGSEGGVDSVWCLSAEDGRPIWRHRYPCRPHQYEGPRATPTVDGDRVYTLSNRGHLFCLDARTGRVRWMLEVPKRLGVRPPQWGFACSPLVLGDQLIIDVGPLVGLEKTTGKVLWKAGSDAPAYGSPMPLVWRGKTLVASFNAHGPIVAEVGTGRVLGRVRWKTAYDVNATTPIVRGDTFFISSGYNAGAAVFQITDGGLREVWRNRNMRNHANNCVLLDGYLYGFDGQVNAGRLTCIAYETGEKRWSEPTLKAGGLMAADGKLILVTAGGECVIVEASPERCRILGRVKVLDDTCWTHPVLANGRIWCRNHEGDLVCLDVRAR